MEKKFLFRDFSLLLAHEKSTMKIGTDAVLLGQWAALEGSRILDIGTGCGVVAMLMSARYPKASVDAIDIDEPSIEEANENIRENGLEERVHAHLSALQDWQGGPYDLIISNPPFFVNSLKAPEQRRSNARHTDTLSYRELITNSARLLAPQGKMGIILPASAEEEIVPLATEAGLEIVLVEHVTKKRILILLTSRS